MSGWDRFMDASNFLPIALNSPFYQAFVFSGMHEDGSREWGSCYVTGNSSSDYTGFGAYCKEGQEPICSHDVKIDGTWVSNANDPTQISPKEMIYRWTSLDNGKSVELHGIGTHSGVVPVVSGSPAPGAQPKEVFCQWYEASSSKTFARSMACIE